MFVQSCSEEVQTLMEMKYLLRIHAGWIAGKRVQDKIKMFHLQTLCLIHKASLCCGLLRRLKFFDQIHLCGR